MPNRALVILAPVAFLAALGCARSETPEEAHAAAQQTQQESDRLSEQGRIAEDEGAFANTSPGQIDTSGSMTPGRWTIATVDGERTARFGEQGSNPVLTIGCETGGGIDIRLLGVSPSGGSSAVYANTPEGGSTFTASDTIGDEAQTYISVPEGNPFISRLISGNGPFSLRMGGDARITFPADDALTSVVSTCDRRAAEAIEEPAPADGNSDSAGDTAGDAQ